MINLHTTFAHHFLDLAIADRVRHIPIPDCDTAAAFDALDMPVRLDERDYGATDPSRSIGSAGLVARRPPGCRSNLPVLGPQPLNPLELAQIARDNH
jgi:hypothetical protein